MSEANQASNPAPISNETAEAEVISNSESETSEQLEAVESNPNLTAKEKAQEIKKIKKLQLKIDGQEFEEELPFELEDDPKKIEWLKRNLQFSKVAQKRMQEQKQLQDEVSQFINELRTNPRKVLADKSLGVDLHQIAKEILEEEIQNSQKSPEQLEREKIENELKMLKEEREREKSQREKEIAQAKYEQEVERYDMKITKALEASTLPKSPYTVKKIAEYLSLAIENGINADPEDVLPLVQAEIQDDIKQMFGVMPEDVIEKIIGKDVLTKVRKKNLAKAPPTPVKKSIPDVGAKNTPKAQPNQQQTFKDFFKV